MIDLADLIQRLQHARISGQTLTRLLDLLRGLQQQRLHLAFGEAAVEVKKGAVLGAAAVAVTVGFAAFEEPLDQRGVQELGRESKRAQQMRLALAQGQGGRAGQRLYPTHIYM